MRIVRKKQIARLMLLQKKIYGIVFTKTKRYFILIQFIIIDGYIPVVEANYMINENIILIGLSYIMCKRGISVLNLNIFKNKNAFGINQEKLKSTNQR